MITLVSRDSALTVVLLEIPACLQHDSPCASPDGPQDYASGKVVRVPYTDRNWSSETRFVVYVSEGRFPECPIRDDSSS